MRTRQQSAPAVISIAPGITPRLLRLRDAPAYLGMDRNRFNAEVRPYVKVLSIGKQGVAFDRLELDQWADRQLVQLVPARIDTAVVEVEHSRRSERPVRKGEEMGRKTSPGLYRRDGTWHIDKRIRGYGRLCESTGTGEIEEAERYLRLRLTQIREAALYGVRPRRLFREAATK